MSFLDSNGYVSQQVRMQHRRNTHGKSSARNWFMPKYGTDTGRSVRKYVYLGQVYVPEDLMGKKLRFKVEVVEE